MGLAGDLRFRDLRFLLEILSELTRFDLSEKQAADLETQFRYLFARLTRRQVDDVLARLADARAAGAAAGGTPKASG